MSGRSVDATAQERDVTGENGCTLRVREYGPAQAPPVVLLHGLLMDSLVWRRTVAAMATDHRVVTVDLRGHGQSDAPQEGSYADATVWAGDVHAVLDQLGLRSPVLVGSSYAGLVVGDYLRRYGDAAVAGVALAAPLRKIGTEDAMALLGEKFLGLVNGLLSADRAEAVPALAEFVRLTRGGPWPTGEANERLGAAVAVSPGVSGGILSRVQDNDDVWRSVGKPVLIAYGTDDAIIRPESSEQLAEDVPAAQVRSYRGAGHCLFADEPDQFAADLRKFVAGCRPVG